MKNAVCLCLMSACLIAFPVCHSAAEVEPNNDIAGANPVVLNGTVDGTLNSLDQNDSIDCYRIETQVDGFLQLAVVPTSELNVEILLKDNDGMVELGYKNDGGNGASESIVYPNLRAGTYYLLIKIPDALAPMKGEYSASIIFLAIDEIDAEPNDNTAQAVEIALNSEYSGHLGFFGGQYTDVRDFYKITLPTDGKLELTVYPDGTGNLGLGLYHSELFHPIIVMDQKGKGESEKIVIPNLRAGTYLVLVYCTEGYGSYNLTNLFTANAPLDTEPNDTVATARPVSLSASPAVLQGNIGYYGNHYRDEFDYYRLSLPSFGNISFNLTMVTGENLSVGYTLWDQSLRLIGGGSAINNLPAGEYYLRLHRVDGYGGYSIAAAFEAGTAPAPLNVAATEWSVNSAIQNIAISADTPEHWFSIDLPDDGSLTLTMQCDPGQYTYLILYSGDGLTEMKKTYSYWTQEEKTFTIPNMRQGNYKALVSRVDGAGLANIRSEFISVAKHDVEPNDEFSSATPIALNQSYQGHIGYSGNGWMDTLDLYALTLPEDGALTVTATFESTTYSYITLFDRTGNLYTQLSQNYGYWNNDPHAVSKVNCVAGDYLVQISRTDGYGSYDFTVEFVPNRSNDPETHGNDFTKAKELRPGDGAVGHLGYSRNFFLDTNDYYKVVLPEDGSFYATFNTDNTTYTYWRIYYADLQTVVAEAYSYWTEDAKTIGSPILRAGTYYITVDRSDGYGTYSFFTRYVPQPVKDADSNHIASQAQILELDRLQQGVLGYKGRYYRDDYDWYRVVIPATDKYKLSLHSAHTGYFHVELYRADMVGLISSNQYNYWNSVPAVKEIDLEAGTYYVKCFRSDGYGLYNVFLGSLAAPVGGTLSGKVTTNTNFPLAEITVSILNREMKTDAMGNYLFDNLPPGIHDVVFVSGTKYYPETTQAVIQPGQTATVNMVLFDSNKTAPKDVGHFFGFPANQYAHFFWSASVSPDVADGGGYRLYINNSQPIDIGNKLYYRSLGFQNETVYSCRLTVYDKYGNESAGKTIVVTPTGAGEVPTPTPTLPVGHPTATFTPSPTTSVPTMTPTVTPTQGVQPSPTPTNPPVIEPSPTQGQIQPLEPVVVYEFDKATLDADGWAEIPGGFNSARPGKILEQYGFSSGQCESSADKVGLAIEVKRVPGEVTFIFAKQAIDTGGHPALIRLVLQSNSPDAQVVVGALKGSVLRGDYLDGSIGYDMLTSTANCMESESRIAVVYRPDAGALINPLIQVSCSSGTGAQVLIDRMDVYILEPGKQYPGDLFADLLPN